MLILDCFEPPSYQGAENIYSHLKRFYLARQSKQQSIPLGWARPFCTPSNSSGHSPCIALRDLRLKWKSRVMDMSAQCDSSSVKLKFGGHTDIYPKERRVSSHLLPLLPNAWHGLSVDRFGKDPERDADIQSCSCWFFKCPLMHLIKANDRY